MADTTAALDVRGAAEAGVEHVGALTGREVTGVTWVRRTDDGWSVGVEVVEFARIPSTTDVLAVYRADLDARGGLHGYRRTARHVRCRPGSDPRD